jgi:hypothetical protein
VIWFICLVCRHANQANFYLLAIKYFSECPIFTSIWYAISIWLGIRSVFDRDGLVQYLNQFEGLVGSGRAFSNRLSVFLLERDLCQAITKLKGKKE